jgi:hypothetical protein
MGHIGTQNPLTAQRRAHRTPPSPSPISHIAPLSCTPSTQRHTHVVPSLVCSRPNPHGDALRRNMAGGAVHSKLSRVIHSTKLPLPSTHTMDAFQVWAEETTASLAAWAHPELNYDARPTKVCGCLS